MSDYDSDVEEGQELDLSNVGSQGLWPCLDRSDCITTL